jgi:hypothetical protein
MESQLPGERSRSYDCGYLISGTALRALLRHCIYDDAHAKATMMEIIASLITSRPMLFIVEIFGVIGGLAMALVHNVWPGDLLPFVVTLIRWSTLIRSVVLVFVSPAAVLRVMRIIRYEQNYYLIAATILLIGVYLTFTGFAKWRLTKSDARNMQFRDRI